MELIQLLKWLEDFAPNETPIRELTSFEYGVLAGQRLMIEQIKTKLKIEEGDI